MRPPPRLAPPEQPYILLVEPMVEDEALAQRVLKKYHIANHVEWTRDGEEALQVLRNWLAPQGGRTAAETASPPAPRGSDGLPGFSLLPAGMGSGRKPGATSFPDRTAQEASVVHPDALPAATPGRGVPQLVLLSSSPGRLPTLEVVRRMRTLPGMARVPVALCCNSPEEEKAARESGLPRVCPLSKPIGFFKLLECIQKMDMHWLVFADKP